MRTLARSPIKHVREAGVRGEASDAELEARGQFLLSEFELLEAKAEADNLNVRCKELTRTSDVSNEVAELVKLVPYDGAIHIEITTPVNEGPVDVTRIFVMKRGDVVDDPEDTVTTFFQIGLEINDEGKETVQNAALFNEISGEGVSKQTILRFNAETGSLEGNHTLIKDGDKKIEKHLDPKACNEGLVEAVETADQPVVEAVSQITKEFDRIDRHQHSKTAIAAEALRAAMEIIENNRASAQAKTAA